MHVYYAPSRYRRNLSRRRLRRRRQRAASRFLESSKICLLGVGAFSSVFKLGQTRALKVTDAGDGALLWFLRFILRHSNVHWPKIVKIRRSSLYTFVWMERLYELNRRDRHIVDCADDLMLKTGQIPLKTLQAMAFYTEQRQKWQNCPTLLSEILIKCYREARAANLIDDSKREKYMRRRGGIIVLSDPFLQKVGGASQNLWRPFQNRDRLW